MRKFRYKFVSCLNNIGVQATYTSELTKDTQVYPRVCANGNYHYETLQIKVEYSSSYSFDSRSNIGLYGLIYENDFDPVNLTRNLIAESNTACLNRFGLAAYLHSNAIYILLVTTFEPNQRDPFTVLISGANNVSVKQISNYSFYF